MPYPKFLRKLNRTLGIVAGIELMIVACMFALESIMRYIFRSPTSWSLDYACYLHCLAMFTACACTYQEHGHVGVELVRNYIEKKTNRAHNRIYVRIMAIVGYVQTLTFIGVLTYGSFEMGKLTVRYGSRTEATFPIPQAVLYGIIVAGCALMFITVVFIILDLFTKSEEYMK